MKIPLKQIAKDCDVSVTTVSRVLNHTGRISTKTRQKILAYVEKQETILYTQNFSRKTIGLITPNIRNEYYSAMISAIEDYFFKRNYSVILHITSKSKQKTIEAFNDLVYRHVAGIIYIGGPQKYYYADDLNQIPLVCIEHNPLIDQACDSLITIDHDAGGYLATQELIKRGCQRILFLANEGMLLEKQGRFSGYIRALEDAHLEYQKELVFVSPSFKFGIMEAKNAIHYLSTKSIEFDGVFATTDWRGYGVIAALNELHVDIPHQVQVIGYDNISISKYYLPSLSTIQVDYEMIASLASQHLDALMNHQAIDSPMTVVPLHFIKRNSTK